MRPMDLHCLFQGTIVKPALSTNIVKDTDLNIEPCAPCFASDNYLL